MIKIAENLFDDKFKTGLKTQFKKTFKGKCAHCIKYVHKAAHCYERETNQERRRIEVFLNYQNR